MFCSPKPSMFESPSSERSDDYKQFLNDDLPMIQALESSSFSPAASPTSVDGESNKKVLTIDTSAETARSKSLQTPVGTRSSPATLAQTPLANAMDVDDGSLLEAFASVSYSPFAAIRADHKAKSPVIFEDKEEDEAADFDDSATTATDMLRSEHAAVNETFELESTTTENMEIPKSMLSLDDLNHIMMSDDCVEQYNSMLRTPGSTRSYFEDGECYVPVHLKRVLHASRGVEMERNSMIRKALIEEELGQLIELATQDRDMDEFEPEAVEAMGIAAYRLAYLRKYHDTQKDEDVYIPSVAYTVMDGSLLELASQHYFGESEEFLVSYAGAMGTAIMKQKHLYQEYNSAAREENHPDAEELNISNVSDLLTPTNQQKQITPIQPDQIMRMVWGVSPKASLMKDTTRRFTFPNEHTDDELCTEPRLGFRKIAIATFYMLALCGAAAFAMVNQAPIPITGPPAIIVPKQTQSPPAETRRPKPLLLIAPPPAKKSPKEDLAKAWKIASSFWKQRFSESKEHVAKTCKGARSFFKVFKQHVNELEVHMLEETHEQLSSLNNDGGKKTLPNLLFEKKSKQLAFLSVEDFHNAMAANHAMAKKKLEGKKAESRAPNSMMKVFSAESFSWSDY